MEGVVIEEKLDQNQKNQKKPKLVDGLCIKKGGRDGRHRTRTEIKRLKGGGESASDIDGYVKMKRPVYCDGFQSQSQSKPSGVGVGVGEEVDDLCDGSLLSVSNGSVSVCGRRRSMEDTVTVLPGWYESFLDFFAVYDGHGGASVAQVCRDKLHHVMATKVEEALERVGGDGNEIDWNKVLEECFLKMDDEVDDKGDEVQNIKSIGSTAVVALVGKNKVIVANCGDSRAVLSRGGVALPLSHDHKPDRPDELERVEAAGGRVINWNGYRVLGVLATSRSIGDQYLRPYVISVPEVSITERTEKDEFVILASDGLWDVMSNEVACHVVRKCLSGRIRFASPQMGTRAAEAAAVLAELAMARGSRDNISVVVIELNNSSSP